MNGTYNDIKRVKLPPLQTPLSLGMGKKLFKVVLGSRYLIVRWKRGPFYWTGKVEIEVGLTRWL